MKKVILGIALAMSALAALPSHANVLTVEDPDRGLNGISTWGFSAYHMQNVYSQGIFGTDKIVINRVSVFANPDTFDFSVLPRMTLKVSTATSTELDVDGYDYASHVGSDAVTFGAATASTTNPGRIDFFGNFTYNPLSGGLIADFERSGDKVKLEQTSGYLYMAGREDVAGYSSFSDPHTVMDGFDWDSWSWMTHEEDWGFGTPTTGYGGSYMALAMQFEYSSAQDDQGAVPEPGSLALLGLGLAGVGFATRRRKA